MAKLEWRLTVPDGSSEELVPESGWIHRAWMGLFQLILALKLKFLRFSEKIWKVGVDDPRRVFHCLKVGVALTLVSLFYYMRPLYNGVGQTAMWAVMTVVVVFEYTVGATLSKGLNRGMATFLAGFLGIAVHSLATQSGEKAEPIIRGISLFLLASMATFSRFIPTVKSRFDYGVSIFILTFSLVSISGHRVDKLVELAHERLATIAIGGSICMMISILICPIWAGEDLHSLVTRNMEKLANSLDGCVVEYFNDGRSETGDEEPCQKLQGYKCVLNSKATEESLANFARWEPAHGHFGFRHPWKQYLKIGTATRFCAYCVEALNGTTNSDIKAPDFIKKHLSDACKRLSSHSCNVLKELATTTKTMRKSANINLLVGEMNAAVEDLQNALKSLPHQLVMLLPPSTENEKKQPVPMANIPLMDILPLVTITSLLIEIATRIEGVVDEVDELAGLANFKPTDDQKPKQNQTIGQEAMEALQQV
ncbi:aluminum-activated malate transporter 10-like [Magnolia sinica]|uniref:aluminum-activated malate transporter 10-like n=1 Tax=Magnolia sinica TaxID=86752 RepID=UPI0026584173|nr:aluminum-activated malate transporter 10-like [Magnolia sinica]